jgi:hypothetical protein
LAENLNSSKRLWVTRISGLLVENDHALVLEVASREFSRERTHDWRDQPKRRDFRIPVQQRVMKLLNGVPTLQN